MEIKVIGTGSKGNCYILTSNGESIMLDCGLSFKKISNAVSLKNIAASLITHEHTDHIKGLSQLELKTNIQIAGTLGTLKAANVSGQPLDYYKTARFGKHGNFEVTAIPTEHDAAQPAAYVIDFDDEGSQERLLYVTDTAYFKTKVPNVTVFLFECNHSQRLLDEHYNAFLANRVARSHMEERTSIDYVKKAGTGSTRAIILIHLSGNNGEPEKYQHDFEKQFFIPTFIAKNGQDYLISNTEVKQCKGLGA